MPESPPWTRRTPSALAARALAVVLPLALVGGALGWLGSGRSEDEQRQLDNAGQLLNGEVLKVPVTQAIAGRLSSSPRLVVLGNSHANTNLHLLTLAPGFGLDARQSTRLSIPNTVGAHWWAILRHHVFAPGAVPPDWVVILADLQSALLTEPQSEGSHGNLLSLLTGPDPVLDARVRRDTSFWWSTVLGNRDGVRRAALDGVRDAAARPAVGRAAKGKVRKAVNEAMDEVFHPARTDLTLFRNVLPAGVENRLVFDPDDLPRPEDSFLPEIARLCAEHGTRLILVRNLPSPIVPVGEGDVVPPGTEAALREVLAPHGGLFLELHRLRMVNELYTNLDHMTEEGARRFTRALVEALGDLGVAEEPDRFGVPPALDGPTGAVAAPPELAALRRSWVGVDAGGVARWTGPAWEPRHGGFRVRAVIEPLAGGRPRVTVAGASALARELPSGRWIAEHRGPPPAGPWSVEIAAEGGPLVVQALEVGAGALPHYAVGYRPDARGHRLDLFGRVEVFDGEAWMEAVAPESPPRPPALAAPTRIGDGPGATAVVDLPDLASLSDFETRQHTPRQARCSPVRVLEDGLPLQLPNVGCKEVRDHGAGRLCHAESRVFFAASDATDPLHNGREYTLGLDPARACDGGAWLYPGDILRFPVPEARMRELRDGADRLHVRLATLPGRSERIAVRVTAGGAVRSASVHDVADLADGMVDIRIDPPVSPDERVVVEVQELDGRYGLLTVAALSADPIPWGGF